MSATSGTVNSRVDKYGLPITVDLHTHKPCGHKDRCSSAKGGCPKCVTIRHAAAPFADLRQVYRKKKR